MIDLDSNSASAPGNFVRIGDVVYFAAADGDHGRELWVTDGTTEGTVLLKDIYSGSESSHPAELTEFNGLLYFVADDGVNGKELWKSDGTAAGTVMVADLSPGEEYMDSSGYSPLSSSPGNLVVSNGKLFFSAEDSTHGVELWMSDGTESGTVMVKDICEGTSTENSSSPQNLVDFDGTLFFTAYDDTNGRELWKSDGTESGTVRVKDIYEGTYTSYYEELPNSSSPEKLTVMDGQLFFIAEDETHGMELWKSDGTESGTVLVADIAAGTQSSLYGGSPMLAVNGILFFAADDGTHGDELWISDGTSNGTKLLKDIQSGSEGNLSYYAGFTAVGDTLFFSAEDGVNGRELWKSDGTESGTVLVADIHPGTSSYGYAYDSYPFYMKAVDGILYFSATDGSSGRELWKSDGTEEGTVLVYDTIDGDEGVFPNSLETVNGYLLFSGYTDDGRELWSLDLDGVASNTARLSIYVNSQFVTLPGNIGVEESGDTAAIYTADTRGTLVLESPGTATLGNFFETWRTDAGLAGENSDATFSATELLGYVANTTYTVQMFVNGQVSTDFDEYAVQDGDEIVLVYGSNPVVSLNTNFGSIVIELFEEETPGTVDNFLDYVNDGDYLNSFFHRSVDDFVIQGGGYTTTSTTFVNVSQFTTILSNGTIDNEPGISNLRGTVAMAKLGGDPDSATSQFFVNLSDDNTFLDLEENNSFTVFGQVLDMTTVDTIAALPIDTSNASPYSELPLDTNDQLVVILSITGLGRMSGVKFLDADADGSFDSGESLLPGVTVYVDSNGNGVLDDGETSTTTDENGAYLLQVEPGTYTIRAVVSAGYVPTLPASADGSYSITVEIGRETSDVDFGEAVLGVIPAYPDEYSMDEDTTLTIDAASGVLSNDGDDDSGELTAVLIDQPSSGTIVFNTDGSFTYTPNADYYGTDSFTYQASDGSDDSNVAGVTITVNNVADPPVAADDSFTVANDGNSSLLDVLANDSSEPDTGQTLSIFSVTQGVVGGTVTIEGDSICYLPPTGVTGLDTFTYTIQDSDGLTDTATVTVAIGNGTTSSGDGTDNDGTGSLSGYVYVDSNGDGFRDSGECGVPGVQITLTGSDDSGNAVNLSVLTQGDGSYSFTGLAPGTYQLAERQPTALADGQESTTISGATLADDSIANIVLESGAYTENNFGEAGVFSKYLSIRMFFASAPSPEQCFLDTIIRAEELAGHTDLADAIRNGDISFEDGNTAPVAVADSYSATAGNPLTVSVGSGVLANDGDADGDSLTATIVTPVSHGSIALSADGSLLYVPNSGFVGTDTFTYRASDGNLVSATTTVTITVVAVNDTPAAVADAYTLNEDATLSVDSTSGVLANDTDDDGDTLTAELISAPAHGTVLVDSDGSFTYTPDENYFGTDSFTYQAMDGSSGSATATVTLTIAAVNDAPAVTDDTYSMIAGETLTVDDAAGVLANDSDVEGEGLTSTVASGPSHGTLTLNADGSFTYTPETGYSGTDSFNYVADDGTDSSAEATVTIAVNGPPDAADDRYEVDEDTVLAVDAVFGVLGNDTDADGDTLSVTLGDLPLHAAVSLNADGSFSYTPEANFYGSDSFTYVVKDDHEHSDTATVFIDVAPVDDPAIVSLPAEFTDPENVAQRIVGQLISFTVGAEDVDDDYYVFQLDLESSGIPEGEALPSIDAETGEFLWTPTSTGRFEIRVIVVNTDGEANQESFLVDIISGD